MTETTDKKKATYDIFPTTMIQKMQKIFFMVDPSSINLDYISTYRDTLKQLSTTGTISGLEKVGSDLLYAMSICATNTNVCTAFELEATRLLKKEESLAFLKRVPQEYYTTKTNKDGTTTSEITDGKAKAYVPTDEEVLKLQGLQNSWQILAQYFRDYWKLFSQSHDWVKKQLDIESKSTPLNGK